MRTVAGADQPCPLFLRHDTNPFPYLPPIRNAAVFRFGTITMQLAFDNMSCGMPLSGVAMISENTAAASLRRFTGSLSFACRTEVVSRGVIARAAVNNIRIGLDRFSVSL